MLPVQPQLVEFDNLLYFDLDLKYYFPNFSKSTLQRENKHINKCCLKNFPNYSEQEK